MLPLLCLGAAVAWRSRAPRATALVTAVGFAAAAAVLAAAARQGALSPTLRTVLDEHVGSLRIETLGPEGDHEPILIRVVLEEDAAIRADYASMRGHVSAVRLPTGWREAAGGVAITVSGESAVRRGIEWRAARAIEAPVTFRRPARYLNEGVPDFERQLALDGTTLFASVKSGLLVEVVSAGSRFEERAADIRAHVRRAVNRWIAPHDDVAAAIVAAVLIGDRTGLPDVVNERLQRAGTYHVIAISGGNIAILAGLVLGALALTGVHGRSAAIIGIAVLLAYAGIAVTGPSVWRATLMAVFYLAARVIDHRMPAWQAITLTAAAMAVVAPLDVRSAGFILTFGATGALLESARRAKTIRLKPDATRIREGRHAASRVLRAVLFWVATSVVASIAVELVLMPVSAQTFSRVTLAGPMLNLAAVPLMAAAQMFGLLAAVGDAWPFVAGPAGWLAFLSASGIVWSARLVDVLPALSWRVPPPGFLLLTLYYVALLTLVYTRRRAARVAACSVGVVALLVIIRVIDVERPAPNRGLRFTVMDVGQGEALLLESGPSTLQIDTGGAPFGSGSFDIGARVLAPALWARGLRSLDAIMLTHGDPDHIGGARALLEIFRPPRLWEGIPVPAHEPSAELRRRALAAGAIHELRRAGEAFVWGSARLRVLHPPEPDWERPQVRNDDSVVVEVTCGDVALLLTGDLGADVERQITPLLTSTRTRILKVGHHGSRTSSSAALLDTWRPQIALVSAGRGNTFGHPAPDVIERLESIGARIYRTDLHGQITLETDCRRVFVRTFNDP